VRTTLFSIRSEEVMHTQHQRRSRRSPRPLYLEVLECRYLLSTYTLTDLGTLPGAVHSYGSAINNLGQVVGYATDGQFHTLSDRAFLWDNGKLTDLGTLGGGASEAYGINDSGQVVGSSFVAPGVQAPRHAFRTAPDSPINPKTDDLGTLPGDRESFALAINNAGQVVGDSDGAATRLGDAFLYRDGAMTGLMVGGGGYATAINNHQDIGQVVGTASLIYAPHAFLWDSGQGVIDLGPPDEVNADAHGINDAGQVVGQSRGVGSLWSDGTMVRLPTLGGAWSPAYAINNAGQIVGMSTLVSSVAHAYIYENGVMADLNDLVPKGSGLTLDTATAINDAGQIVVNAWDADRIRHAVLLTPDDGGAARAVDPGVSRVLAPVHEAAAVGASTGQPPAGAPRERAAAEAGAPLPAGAAARPATDAFFAGSHRAHTPAGEGAWEVEGLPPGLPLVPPR
jgi:probable HAF family extracellular repeat protein